MDRSGFSLVELSIVLVILGLLTGGVLTGQSLIRAAELRSVTTDLNQYQTAIYTFKDKYFSLPGDMTNATAFWGAADGNDGLGSDCFDATSTNGSTCNGDGTGILEGGFYIASAPMNSSTNAPEWWHSWIHLSNAGLVNGSFTGRREDDDRQAVPGVNIPASSLSGGGYTLMSSWRNNSFGDWYSGFYKLMIILGTTMPTVETQGVILRPSEVWGIDKKIDDGKPGLGLIRTFHDNIECVTSTDINDQRTAEYSLNVDDVTCNLVYSFTDPGVIL